MDPKTYDRGAAIDTLRQSLRQLYSIDRAVAAFVTGERQHVISSGCQTPPDVRELLRELERLTDRIAPHRIGLEFLMRHLDNVVTPQLAEEEE